MNTETKTKLVAWNGETYAGLADLYDQFAYDEEFLEFTGDLDPDELLRLAIFGYNDGASFVPEDMPLLISAENDAFWSEAESEAEFARRVAEEYDQLPEGMPSWVVIDWETSWNANLRHDFFVYDVIDIDGNFRKFFWGVG